MDRDTDNPRRRASSKRYYHTTFARYLDSIARDGLEPGHASNFSGGYSGHSSGKVFLGDWRSVSFWIEKLWNAAEARADDPVVEGLIPVVLRVDLSSSHETRPDEAEPFGESVYVERAIPAERIQVWDGDGWVNLGRVWPEDIIEEAKAASDVEEYDGMTYHWYDPDHLKPKTANGDAMPRTRRAMDAKKALEDLYEGATGRQKSGNPYQYEAVRNARRALGDPSGYDLPERRPSGKVKAALYDLSKWSTSDDRRRNPYSYEAVKQAAYVLRYDDFSGKDASCSRCGRTANALETAELILSLSDREGLLHSHDIVSNDLFPGRPNLHTTMTVERALKHADVPQSAVDRAARKLGWAEAPKVSSRRTAASAADINRLVDDVIEAADADYMEYGKRRDMAYESVRWLNNRWSGDYPDDITFDEVEGAYLDAMKMLSRGTINRRRLRGWFEA